MLAAHAGCEAEVAAVTERGDARRARLRGVACASGSPCSRASTPSALDEVYDDARARPGRPHPGAHPQAARLPVRDRVAAASPRSPTGSPPTSASTSPRANELEVVDGRLTGRIVGPVVDRAGKAEALRRFAARGRRPAGRRRSPSATAPTTSTCSAAAGLGIAFNAKPVVQRGRRHGGQRALPRRDHVPARHQPRGGRGRRRRCDGVTTPRRRSPVARTQEPSAAADVEADAGRPVSASSSAHGTATSKHGQRRRAGSPAAARRRPSGVAARRRRGVGTGTPRSGCGRRKHRRGVLGHAPAAPRATASGLPVNTASSKRHRARRVAPAARDQRRPGLHGCARADETSGVVGHQTRVQRRCAPAVAARRAPRGRSARRAWSLAAKGSAFACRITIRRRRSVTSANSGTP